jgi:2-polyprenyl-3-methyl-5-hydroxy-6-metoxy-1,4-benzoquinol methylase
MRSAEASRLYKELEEFTLGATGDYFVEHSQERELAYLKNSALRWSEILRVINRWVERPMERSCLDIGVTPFTFALSRRFKQVSALDLAPAFESRCKKAGIQYYAGGILCAPDLVPDGSFDCILCLEVLEHLHMNPVSVFTWLKNKLKQRGVLILSTPNMMCLSNRIRMLFNQRLAWFDYPPFAESEFADRGHQHDRVYMPAELRMYLAATSWSKSELGYQTNLEQNWFRRSTLLQKLYRPPVTLLKTIFPSFNNIILVVAQK